MLRQPKQLELPSWGGRRTGAGRKPGPLTRVRHRPRPQHAPRYPLHAVLRTRPDVPRLRRKELIAVVRQALRDAGLAREAFRVVHYSVQGN